MLDKELIKGIKTESLYNKDVGEIWEMKLNEDKLNIKKIYPEKGLVYYKIKNEVLK